MHESLTQSLAFSKNSVHGNNNNSSHKLNAYSGQGIILSDLIHEVGMIIKLILHLRKLRFREFK